MMLLSPLLGIHDCIKFWEKGSHRAHALNVHLTHEFVLRFEAKSNSAPNYLIENQVLEVFYCIGC